jgi:hypothetical protein
MPSDRTTSPRDPSNRQLLGLAWDVVQPWLGWICVGLGFLALILGWVGVSGETIVEKQLPFLLSGGLAGIALVVFGARLLLIQDLRRDSGRLDRLETMVAQLHGALLSRSDAPRVHTSAVAAGSGTLMALPTGTSFHTASCPMLTGKERAEPVADRDIASRSLVACPLCEPAAVSA